MFVSITPKLIQLQKANFPDAQRHHRDQPMRCSLLPSPLLRDHLCDPTRVHQQRSRLVRRKGGGRKHDGRGRLPMDADTSLTLSICICQLLLFDMFTTLVNIKLAVLVLIYLCSVQTIYFFTPGL